MAQAIRDELIEELLQGYSSPQDLLGEEGLFKELKKRLLERALGAELSEHLGYEKGDPAGRGGGNSRNGYSSKTVIGDDGAIEIAVPRDRNGSFEPQIVAKGQTRLDGFDDRIISLYARGLSVREIQAHLQELYGVEVSPDLISRVTDAVLEEVREWQNRPLDPVYPVIFFDALRVKIRDEGLVRNKAVYVALALNGEGEKEVLGLWIEQTEGAKFWLKVMNELKTRGVNDVLIAVVDGLKGFPEAIAHGLSADHGADLHHPSDPQLAGLCVVEGPQAGHARSEGDLSGGNGRGGRRRTRRLRGRMGQAIPGNRPGVAAGLGACGAAVRLPAGDPQDDLHNERRGKPQSQPAQDHQDPRQLPDRRSSAQTAVSGDPQCWPQLASAD